MPVDRDLLRSLVESIDRAEPVVLATVVDTDRSVPRHAGSKMLVFGDRRQIGTIGGGEMEARVIDAAVEAIADGRARQMDFDLVDPASGDPGVCGGSVSLYLEPYMPQPHLVVVGCGHVGRAVIDLAHWLGFHVTAVDDRPELATAENVPLADEVIAGPLAESLTTARIDDQTHVVLVTRNVGVDLDVLPVVLDSPARSIGVMGSRRRWDTTRDKLLATGADPVRLERVTAPIGLEINAETPEEIALSVLSEIVRMRRAPPTDPR